MKSLTKKFKDEWQFFIDPVTNKLSYNELCKSCISDCKQSYRTDIVFCKHYEKLPADEKND